MKCKRSLMGLAGILIVIFHFYMPLTDNSLEQTIYRASYLGVDLFFFLSAYSLGSKRIIKYGEFILNRLVNVYLPFVFFSLIAFVYGGWKISKLFRVITGVEFFRKGGGSFLWFFPGIMLFYLFTPIIKKLKNKMGLALLPLGLIIWLVSVSCLQFVFCYTDIFVLLNRLPIFLLGFFYDDIIEKMKGREVYILIPLLLIGGFFVYRYGACVRLGKPITDIYYLIDIPFVFALIGIIDYLNGKGLRESLFLRFVGGFTLELYAVQMIFGVDIESYLFKHTGNCKIITFILTLLCLIGISYLTSLCKKSIFKFFRKGEKV